MNQPLPKELETFAVDLVDRVTHVIAEMQLTIDTQRNEIAELRQRIIVLEAGRDTPATLSRELAP